MRKNTKPILFTAAGLAVATGIGAAVYLKSEFNTNAHIDPATFAAGYRSFVDDKAIDAIVSLGQRSNYVVLGDMGHQKISIRNFTFRPKVAAVLAEAGFKFIAIEKPYSYQVLIDGLANGDISRRDFVTTMQVLSNGYSEIEYGTHLETDADKLTAMEALADFIIEAKDHGMKVLAVDGREGNTQAYRNAFGAQSQRFLDFAKFLNANPDVYQHDPEAFITKYYQDALPDMDPERLAQAIQGNEQVRKFIADNTDNNFYEFAGAVYRAWAARHYRDQIINEVNLANDNTDRTAFLTRRLSQDNEVAQRIRDLTQGEKTLILYGAAHSFHAQSNLAQELDNAPTLLMLEKVSDYQEFLEYCGDVGLRDNGCVIKDRHFLFLFNDGIVMRAASMERGLITGQVQTGNAPS